MSSKSSSGSPNRRCFEQSLGDNYFPVDFEQHRAATLPVLASIAKDEVEVGGFAVVFGIPGDGTFTGVNNSHIQPGRILGIRWRVDGFEPAEAFVRRLVCETRAAACARRSKYRRELACSAIRFGPM